MQKENSDPVSEVKSILEDEFQSIKSVKEVVNRVGGNYNTCRAKFWREMGCSMKEYLIKQKLAKAKELLAKPNYLIKQVALYLNYNDEAAFVRQFKKYTGLTPGDYQIKINGIA